MLCSSCLKPPRGRVIRTVEGLLPPPPLTVAGSFTLGLWEETAAGHSMFKGQQCRRSARVGGGRAAMGRGSGRGKGEPAGVGGGQRWCRRRSSRARRAVLRRRAASAKIKMRQRYSSYFLNINLYKRSKGYKIISNTTLVHW